jgi:protein O-GlcNAc transferase
MATSDRRPATGGTSVSRAIEQALAFHQQGRLNEAERLYREALRASPRDFDALHLFGVLRLHQGNPTEAVGLISRAVELRPSDVDALSNLSAAFLMLDRYEEALVYCDRILAIRGADVAALQNRGVALIRLDRIEEALASFERVLAVKPDHVGAEFNRGTILVNLGRFDEALASFDRTIVRAPTYVDAHNNRGNLLARVGRNDEAVASYDRALSIDPKHVTALTNRCNALRQLGRPDEAFQSIERALALAPDIVESLNSRGNVLLDLHRPLEALATFDRALVLRPGDANVHTNRAFALHALDRYADALLSTDAALVIASDYVPALVAKGDSLRRLARHEEALASYERALAVSSADVGALVGRGAALIELARLDEALASFEAALALDPANTNALNTRGFVLNALNRREEALASYERALRIDPRHADVLNNRGVVLWELGHHAAAIASFDEALVAAPEHTGALCNRAKVLGTLRRYDEALASTERALAIDPHYADALFTRGIMLVKLQRDAEAIAAINQALAVDPQHPLAETVRAHAEALQANAYLANCDWPNSARMALDLEHRVGDGKSVIAPFVLFGYPLDAADVLACTERFVAREFPQIAAAEVERIERPSDRIKLAYLSGDFGRHPLSYLIVELFERHDRERFEVIGVSCGPNDGSDIRARVVRSFERFHDVAALSDGDVVKLLRDEGADIVVDLSGYTVNGRSGILAYRPAPIQVNYLGFLGSMGAEFIDYVIGDETVMPHEQQSFYDERIVRLPHCFQVNDSTRPISAHVPTRHEAGLPEQGFVFCCFNANYKITAPVFDIWTRLLQAVDGSVLWLFHSNDVAAANLQREAAARGIDPARLIFAARTTPSEHLARHRLANLFLDTLPINAGATASDALWAGLPIVTLLGNAFPGRISASLLRAIGLPELVTNSADDYEALALRLAREPALLDAIRRKVSDNRLTSPLFDTDRFRRHIEAAYTTMVDIHRRGERPRSFSVEPITG